MKTPEQTMVGVDERVDARVHEKAAYYLKALAEGSDVPGGMAFRTALRQSTLDGSVESLDRIDHLLDQIRARFKPDYDSFVAPPSNQNFLAALVFYIGALVARHSGMPIRWLDYDSLIQRFPSAEQAYPRCLTTSITCLLGDNIIFVPMSAIFERLFDAQPGQGVRISATPYLVNRRGLLAFRDPGPAPRDAAPPVQRHGDAMHQAGQMAAGFVRSAAHRVLPVPTFGATLRGGQRLVTPLMHDGPDRALTVGLQRLESNADGALHTVLVHATRLNLAEGPTDGIVVEVRAFPGPDFGATLVVPYRGWNDARGFAVQELTLSGSTAEPSLLPWLIDCFYRGVHEQPEAAHAWRLHLEQRA